MTDKIMERHKPGLPEIFFRVTTITAITAGCAGARPRPTQTYETQTQSASNTLIVPTPDSFTPSPEINDIVKTPEATEAVFSPPNNPPVYDGTGYGGPLPETNPLSAGFNRARFVMLSNLGINIDQNNFATYEEFVSAIDTASKNNSIDVIQAVSLDGMQTLSMAVKTEPSGERMFLWMADSSTSLLSARPDVPPSTDFLNGEVIIPSEYKDYKLQAVPATDGNFYMFLVGVDGKAVAWASATEGYVDENGVVVNLWNKVYFDGTPLTTKFDMNSGFSTANQETLTVGGVEYNGYLLNDEYGQRLVDGVNQIILVKEGETWRKPTSKEFSANYPAVWYERSIGNADGLQIPITLGVTQSAVNAPIPAKEIHGTQEGFDAVASYFLHSCWLRYRDYMNHPGITYESYLELLKVGKGNINILTLGEDGVTKKVSLLDPRQGFSAIVSNDAKLPIWAANKTSFFVGADEKGRYLFATNLYILIDEFTGETADDELIYNMFTMVFANLNSTSNDCLNLNNINTCGYKLQPDAAKLTETYVAYLNTGNKLFSITR